MRRFTLFRLSFAIVQLSMAESQSADFNRLFSLWGHILVAKGMVVKCSGSFGWRRETVINRYLVALCKGLDHIWSLLQHLKTQRNRKCCVEAVPVVSLGTDSLSSSSTSQLWKSNEVNVEAGHTFRWFVSRAFSTDCSLCRCHSKRSLWRLSDETLLRAFSGHERVSSWYAYLATGVVPS